MVGQIAQSLII